MWNSITTDQNVPERNPGLVFAPPVKDPDRRLREDRSVRYSILWFSEKDIECGL